MNNLNLNKENIWNDLNEKFPKAMKKFCDWIDEYKKDNEWNWIFGNHDKIDYKKWIRFHDIPFEMQVGIIFKFFKEHNLLFNSTSMTDVEAGKKGVIFLMRVLNDLL